MSAADEGQIPAWMTVAEAYQEAWKRDHDLAMECRDCEELVAIGLHVYGLLEEREARWRDQVFHGAVPFEAKLDEAFRRAHELWVMTTQAILQEQVDGLERQFDEVKVAGELRRLLSVVQAALSDWQPPRLSRAVGLRDHQLTEEGAAALDRIMASTAPLPYVPQGQPAKELSADEFKRRLKR
jgi:hypothetical protein